MNLSKKPIEVLSNLIPEKISDKRIKPYFLIFYAILIISILYNLAYARRVIPGVRVAGINIGGMSFYQAKRILEKSEEGVFKELKFRYEDKVFTIKDSDIELKYDLDGTVAKAFEVGRTGNILIDTKDKIASLFKGLNLPLSYDYDEESLGVKLSIIRGDINIEPQKSVFYLKDGKLEISLSSNGREIIEEDFYEIILSSLNNMDFSEDSIPVKVVEPYIVEKDLELFKGVVEEKISKDLTLKFNEMTWVLEKDRLLELMGFEKEGGKVFITMDEYAFEKLASELSLKINKSPRGKVISTAGNIVTEFKIVGEGKELDVEGLKDEMRDSLLNTRKDITLKVNTVAGDGDADKYGIVALLGEGVSHYAGSIPSRIHNLTLAAENTNGVLVPPGGIYSMNDSVGPIDYQHGFQSAYIIKGGRTVLGEGGGVCQTSTTLFRAVLNSGLPVVSRYPHAYRVGYYEQDMPVGFDAAIFQPSWDFKFKNDTKAYVLVQSSANLEENSLTFRLFGTPDGRIVEISEPVITGQFPPPPALYEDDPDLPKGVVRQVDYAAWGATSTFTRTVKKGDEVLFADTFTSKYQPWRAIFRVGTKE